MTVTIYCNYCGRQIRKYFWEEEWKLTVPQFCKCNREAVTIVTTVHSFPRVEAGKLRALDLREDK